MHSVGSVQGEKKHVKPEVKPHIKPGTKIVFSPQFAQKRLSSCSTSTTANWEYVKGSGGRWQDAAKRKFDSAKRLHVEAH